MLAAPQPFELLDKIGVKTGINRERIMKLVESTNVLPQVLVDRGYQFRTNIDTGH